MTEGLLQTTFNYGPDLSRFYREDKNNNQITRQTYYLAGGDYEEVIDAASGDVKVKHQLSSNVQFTLTKKPNQAVDLIDVQFMHKDHLGSIDAITDLSGNVIEQMAFQPFGDRKQQTADDLNPAGDVNAATFATTTDGFTGHEMLDDFGLIHMNGRVYDPQIGRFLSADPFVQAPENSQSYNRYSYVVNSPLSLVDPSGYVLEPIESAGLSDYHLRGFVDLEIHEINVSRYLEPHQYELHESSIRELNIDFPYLMKEGTHKVYGASVLDSSDIKEEFDRNVTIAAFFDFDKTISDVSSAASVSMSGHNYRKLHEYPEQAFNMMNKVKTMAIEEFLIDPLKEDLTRNMGLMVRRDYALNKVYEYSRFRLGFEMPESGNWKSRDLGVVSFHEGHVYRGRERWTSMSTFYSGAYVYDVQEQIDRMSASNSEFYYRYFK